MSTPEGNAPVNAAVLVLAPVEAAGIAGGIATTVRTVAMTIGPATAALAWTWAGGADPGFEAGVLTLSAAAAAGLLVLLPVVRTDQRGSTGGCRGMLVAAGL